MNVFFEAWHEIWDLIGPFIVGGFKGSFTAFLAWMGYLMFKEIRKAWKMDQKLKGRD